MFKFSKATLAAFTMAAAFTLPAQSFADSATDEQAILEDRNGLEASTEPKG